MALHRYNPYKKEFGYNKIIEKSANRYAKRFADFCVISSICGRQSKFGVGGGEDCAGNVRGVFTAYYACASIYRA